MRSSPRGGTILILVAGVAALVAGLSLAFLLRMRSDAEEVVLVVRDAQARIMLIGACSYVLEASRLGWDDASSSVHEECYGWIDVRDGKLGPKPEAAGVDDDSRFPIGHVARLPAFVMRRPPSAVQVRATYNPIETDAASPDFGMPYLSHPDPQPEAASWSEFKNGDQRPRPGSSGRAWARVYRDGPDTFTITCGAGATYGFRSWAEVVGENEQDLFNNDAQLYEDARRQETRMWYRVQWSPAVGSMELHNPQPIIWSADPSMRDFGWAGEYGPVSTEHYITFAVNASQSYGRLLGETDSVSHGKNLVGTLRYVQRLIDEPSNW